MADTENSFEQYITTYRELHELTGWPAQLVEDYFSIKRNTVVTVTVADNAQSAADDAQSQAEDANFLAARIHHIQAQVGSGNPLTSDETGFTVDSTRLSVDMDEA
jgi:hypothetical protein